MDKGKFIMLKYLRRIIVIVAILMVLLSHAPMAQAAPLAQSINSSGGNPKEAAGHPLPGIGSDPCAPIVVSNTNNSGPGSLRQAMVDICAGGTITFDAALSGMTIALASSLSPAQEMTIDGSALASPITISGDTDNDGTGNVRVFYISTGLTVNLIGLRITKGNSSSGSGGGILNGGTLTVTECTIFDNTTRMYGGGISNSGLLEVRDSTISGNSATRFYGGGIYNIGTLVMINGSVENNLAESRGGGIANSGPLTLTDSTLTGNSTRTMIGMGGGLFSDATGGTVTVTNSTISGNSAYAGGGMYIIGTLSLARSTLTGNTAHGGGGLVISTGATATVTNSTFAGNSGTSSLNGGGGIFNEGSLTVNNSTFSGNAATTGAAIRVVGSGTATVSNTIIANSQNGGNCNGPIIDHGHNLQFGGLVAVSCGVTIPSGDPNLAALADYGGPTRSMELQTGSAAIDAGDDDTCEAVDQRGISRPHGVHCDIGAFEWADLEVTYHANGATSGTVPQTQVKVVGEDLTLAQNTGNLARRGYVFGGWNTQADGLGGHYDAGATYTLDAGLALYAEWSQVTALPATGFAPGRVTALEVQPQEKIFTDLGSLWLEIPQLGVEMPIVGVPLLGDEWDVSWLGSSAGWLEGSAYPTWQGNSVVTGHVWNADNTPGPFRHLDTLRWGDRVIVHLGGGEYIYEVRRVLEVSPTKVSTMMQHEEQAWLTLVTCKGYDGQKDEYRLRTLVRAVLVEVK